MDLVLRATTIFFFLFILTRVIGKRELGSLQPFDLMLLIVLGDALQQGITQDDYSVTGALLIVGTFAVLQVALSWTSYRFPTARPILEGEPIIVLQDGQLIERNLKRERLTIDDITEGARKQGIAHLTDVHYAILETDGTLSFLQKAD
jgi:uncharacterized membrane protein YcaP (DUF421 family)